MQKNKYRLYKFDSVELLEDAYSALEAEFTKRCQQNRELKKQIAELQDKIRKLESADLLSLVMADENIKREVVNDYLSSVLSRKHGNVLTSKVGCSAFMPPDRPKTLKDAQRLADILISQQN